MFCDNVKTESDCDAARSCVWYENDYSGSAYCYHDDVTFCANVETESDCDAARSCVWHDFSDGSGRCFHTDDEFHAMIGESDHDFGTDTCWDLANWHAHGDSEEAAAMCNAESKL